MRGIDPETGNYYYDTKRYIEAANLTADDRTDDCACRRRGPRGSRGAD